MDIKYKLEERVISENCKLNTYITGDEQSYILEIDFLKGKFISQKTFPNNLGGIALMEEIKNIHKTELDIIEYFGIL